MGLTSISSKYSHFGPFQEYFQQIACRPVVEAPLTLLEIEVEVLPGYAIVPAKMTFGLVPEILNPVDVIAILGKEF